MRQYLGPTGGQRSARARSARARARGGGATLSGGPSEERRGRRGQCGYSAALTSPPQLLTDISQEGTGNGAGHVERVDEASPPKSLGERRVRGGVRGDRVRVHPERVDAGVSKVGQDADNYTHT